MKKCKCGETDLSKFGKAIHRKDGLKPLCKKCHNEYNNKLRRDSPENHRKTNLAYAQSPEGKSKQRANSLRRKYWPNLTNEQAVAEYDRLLLEQHNTCALCPKHISFMKTAFHVDHCKRSGIVRGLLCDVCNRIVVQDKTIEQVKKLYDYFTKYHIIK